jgi:hypothetical protein
MALIADVCPHCRRITRCQVTERTSVSGGIVMGIPIVIPHSSTTFGCGECGCEFQSETWNQHRSLSPAESVGLDLEQILSLTNPVLYERVMLERLRADARLEEVFVLLGKLRPSSLHSDLKRSLMNWSQLDEEQCIHFLTSTRRCTEAICFTEVMANRSKSGAVGCLGGILGSAGVWIGCIALFGTNVSLMGSLGILFAGLLTGTSVSGLLWSARDRSWLQAVASVGCSRFLNGAGYPKKQKVSWPPSAKLHPRSDRTWLRRERRSKSQSSISAHAPQVQTRRECRSCTPCDSCGRFSQSRCHRRL